jgi:hypothetical protein
MASIASDLRAPISRFRIVGSPKEMEEQGGHVAESGKICLWGGVLAQHGGLLTFDSLVDRLRDF